MTRKENEWMLGLQSRMRTNLTAGNRRYIKTDYVRGGNRNEIQAVRRKLMLEDMYRHYARFTEETRLGRVSECFTYDEIKRTMEEDE